jgi:LacI family transcriptional regulator
MHPRPRAADILRNPSKLSAPRRVAVLIETSTAYGRGLLRGVHAFIREHGQWVTYLPEQEKGDSRAVPLKTAWQGDGIIARIDNRLLARQLGLRHGTPVIDVCSNRFLPGAPCIETDDQAIAKLAAQHFLERNFKNFAYCGDDRFHWAIQRGVSFIRFISDAGCDCHAYRADARKRRTAEQEEKHLAEWIRELPKPIGIMASHDFRGWQLLEACRLAGAMVPDEVAVIGVDNDELLCDLSDPPLTSISPDAFRTGYLAAEAMERWIDGEALQEDIAIKPSGVVTRKSTDVFAVAEPNVSHAVRLIRERACRGIRVSDVLKAVPISRTVLDLEFKKLLGHSAHEEIGRVQFQRVIELLTETTLPLVTIAQRAGFRHAEYLTYAFKQRFGVPPSKYREMHRK